MEAAAAQSKVFDGGVRRRRYAEGDEGVVRAWMKQGGTAGVFNASDCLRCARWERGG